MFRLIFLLFAMLAAPAFSGECPDSAEPQHVLWIVGSTLTLALATLLLASLWRGLRQFVFGRTA